MSADREEAFESVTDRPPAIYEAAGRFRRAALEKSDSLFTPGTAIWTAENIADLEERFVGHPDASKRSFIEKFQDQLAGAPSPTIQLAAELMFVNMLPVSDSGAGMKRSLIARVLSWGADHVKLPVDLEPAMEHGISNFGPALAQRPFHLAFLIGFLKKWKSLSDDERGDLLADPWGFKDLVVSLPTGSAQAQREALLMLVFPATFEPIVSVAGKSQIARFFSDHVMQPTEDVDRQLAQIRASLANVYGPRFDFYQPDIRILWNPPTSGWDAFIHWAQRFSEWDELDANERDYKLALAEKFRKAREALLVDRVDWFDVLKRALSKPSNNLTPWQLDDDFRKWCRANLLEAKQAMKLLWDGDDVPVSERIGRFERAVPSSAYRSQPTVLTSVLLLAIDPLQYPPFRPTPFQTGFKLCEFDPFPQEAGAWERYKHALSYLDRMMLEASARNLELRDRLDAQSLLWAITKTDAGLDPISKWPETERKAFLKFRGDLVIEDDTISKKPDENENEEPSESLASLAGRLLIAESHLQEWIELLRDKRQLVFYGPPGTGKTFIAQALMEHLAQDPHRREVVQFHPSYSYEDFVQGYRPVTLAEGNIGYELKDGPLMRLAREARNSKAEHVLLIDELNRGNLPKILGELLFLLEYRKKDVSLMYQQAGEHSFRLPENLLIIATMNTADRSIGLIDAALRRRFHFVPLFPDQGPLKGILAAWLQKHVPDMIEVAEVVQKLNQKLRAQFGAHLQLGHSYFMKETLDESLLRRIWDYDVRPFLEDQLFGPEMTLEPYELSSLRESSNANDRVERVREEALPSDSE
jgi:5-methylcytosine-specific restriction enzyme B